jgi:hypothetical protein
MKLSKNQKNGFYIGLTVFLGLCFGLVVFFIVQHFKNKNTNNCTPNCNGKFCGDDGCKGNCGNCPSSQTCGQDGKCSGTGCISVCDGKNCGDDDGCGNPCQEGICPQGQTCISGKCGTPCISNCNGIKCGDDDNCGMPCQEGICPPGHTCISGKCSDTCTPDCTGKNCGDDDNCGKQCQDGICPSGQTCISGKCNPNTPDTCYHKDENPFGNPPGACSQKRLKCCDNLQFCFDKNTNSYVCRDKKLSTDNCKGDQDFKFPDCTKIPDCKGSTSTQFCPCYQKDEDPFGNPPGACSQNRLQCCDDLQFCFDKNTNSYVCRDKTKKLDTDICEGDQGFKFPDCTKISNCKGSSQFCPS